MTARRCFFGCFYLVLQALTVFAETTYFPQWLTGSDFAL